MFTIKIRFNFDDYLVTVDHDRESGRFCFVAMKQDKDVVVIISSSGLLYQSWENAALEGVREVLKRGWKDANNDDQVR